MRKVLAVPGPSLVQRLLAARSAIVATLLIALMVFAGVLGRTLWRVYDTSGTRSLSGSAVIVDRSSIILKGIPHRYVTFRMGRLEATNEVYDVGTWWLADRGDLVPVRYRIGRSGALYVEDWDPIPHPRRQAIKVR